MRKDKDNILLEDYTNLELIGKGGYATVYKVRHNELEYVRAIKVLNSPITSEDDEIYKKFLKECRLLLRLGNGNHPNIVHIFQPLFRSNLAFVEMDYVTGEDITHFVERVKFVPIEDVILFVKEIGSALAYCHVDIYKYCYDREKDNLKDDPNDGSKVLIDDKTRKRLINKYRVVHNDIHSGNIRRTDTGHYVLLDFGLAIQDGEVSRKSQRTNGAPEYKAPEKDNDEISSQSDIYSFGVVLYQLLTGHVPFVYNKTVNSVEAEYELLKAHKTRIPAPIINERKKCYEEAYKGKAYNNDVPKWLIEIVERCLKKNPMERFRDGKDLLDYVPSKDEVYNSTEKTPTKRGIKEIIAIIRGKRIDNKNNDQEKPDFTFEAKQKKDVQNDCDKVKPDFGFEARPKNMTDERDITNFDFGTKPNR